MTGRKYDILSRNRRSILKTSAAALVGGATLPVITVARSERASDKVEKLYNTSLKILEKRGPGAQAKFLENHDIPHAYQKNAYVMDPPEARNDGEADENSVSIQSHFDDDACVEPENCGYDPDLECSLSISYDRYDAKCYVNLATRYRYRYYHYNYCHVPGSSWRMDGPQDPMDGFGLIWERDHWQLANDDYPAQSIYSSSNVDWDNGSSLGEGAGFRADGRQHCYDSGPTEPKPYDDNDCRDKDNLEMEWSDWLYGRVQIQPGSDHEDDDKIRGKYVYQYNEQGNDFSIAVAYPWGVSISWSSSTSVKEKSTQTEPDGKNLAVTLSDAF